MRVSYALEKFLWEVLDTHSDTFDTTLDLYSGPRLTVEEFVAGTSENYGDANSYARGVHPTHLNAVLAEKGVQLVASANLAYGVANCSAPYGESNLVTLNFPWTQYPDNIIFNPDIPEDTEEEYPITWGILSIRGASGDYHLLTFIVSVGDLNSEAEVKMTKTLVTKNTHLRISNLTLSIDIT